MVLTYKTISAFCSEIDLTQTKSLIDLSDLTFIDTFALIYLGLYIRYFNSQGKAFSWARPKDKKARNYLARQQFYQHFNFVASFTRSESLICTPSSTCWNDIKEIKNVDYIAEDIADEVRDLLINNGIKAAVGDICEITAEMVQNFAEHSKEEQAVITIQWFPNIGWLSLALGDCGIGVKESLCSNRRYWHLRDMHDRHVISEAFKAGVSRKSAGGTGLTNLRETIKDLEGTLYFASNSGYLRVEQASSFIGTRIHNFPGVQMEIGFPARG